MRERERERERCLENNFQSVWDGVMILYEALIYYVQILFHRLVKELDRTNRVWELKLAVMQRK